MKPVIVLVGRPNVGKSTLFNRLSGGPRALVAEAEGLTRDRQYAAGTVGDRPYLVVDTGGLVDWAPPDALSALMSAQAWQAIRDADAIIWLVDGRSGPNTADREIANALRKQPVPVWLAVNKTEGMDAHIAAVEFHELGMGEPLAISAAHGDGVTAFMQRVLAELPRVEEAPAATDRPEIAIVGRPNVGKSTLVNTLLGEERVLVFDSPGTTRDSVHIPLARVGRHYVLIDTAGVRRRAKTRDVIEKYSVIKTLHAIEAANVVVLVLDAQDGISDQDALLGGFILERGRAVVVAVNKWDALDEAGRARVKNELERKLGFLRFARTHLISALRGTGVAGLFASVDRAFASARKTLTTPKLNRVLRGAVRATAPPRANGGPVRLKFAHQGGKNPPLVVIHGSRVDRVPASYRRYLARAIRTGFDLEGTPVRIEFRIGENPFTGRASRQRRPAPKQRARKKPFA
ncbi:MAG: ribosome biogenesis GTPase Der [Acidiferrobacterales bacterium]